MFASCETRACINVTIEDDNVVELTESFSVKLNRTDGLDERIILEPVEAEIEIINNDGEWVNNVTNWLFILFIFLILMQGPC